MAAESKHLYESGSSSVLWTDRRDFYIEPNIVKELWTDDAPFLTFTANMSQKSNLPDPMFKMFQHENPWTDQRFTCADTDSFSDTDSEVTVTLPAQSATNTYGLGTARGAHYQGLICGVHSNDAATGKPTGARKGVVAITTYTNGTTIVCKNMGSTAFTLVSGDWFVIIGNAYGEGTTSPVAWSDELSVVWNQCQIFRTPLKLTRTLMKAALRGEASELLRLRKQKGSEHKIQKNRAFLYGTSKLGTNLTAADTFADATRTDASGNTLRTTMGAMECILKYGATTGDDQNIFSIPEATYSYSNFVDDVEKVFRYSPNENQGQKYMFCGAKMLGYWSKLEGSGGRSGFTKNSGWSVKISETQRDKLGFNVRILETPFGLLRLVPETALTFSPYSTYGMVIGSEHLFHAIYDSPLYKQNIETNNAPDYQKDEYFSDEGIGLSMLKVHKLFKLV